MDIVNETSADIERNASRAFVNITAGASSYKEDPAIAHYVIDTQANVMAHSGRHELVGTNEMNRSDVSGKKFIEAMVMGALKSGVGQEDYIYSDPRTDSTTKLPIIA
jgi:signal transduction histidine kinase